VKYRICTKCEVPHYENCKTCFGFGVYKINDCLYPIITSEAIDNNYNYTPLPCPECGSTTKGIP